MENQEAINVLIQVAHLAQQRGLLTLEDALIVAKAIETLTPKVEKTEKTQNTKASKIGGGILVSPR